MQNLTPDGARDGAAGHGDKVLVQLAVRQLSMRVPEPHVAQAQPAQQHSADKIRHMRAMRARCGQEEACLAKQHRETRPHLLPVIDDTELLAARHNTVDMHLNP